MTDKERASSLIKENKFDEAAEIINSLLNEGEINSSDDLDELYYFLGVVQLANKNYAMAKVLFEKSLSLNPKTPCVNNNLGVCYKSLGHVVESRKFFEEAVKQSSFLSATDRNEWHRNMSIYLGNYGSVYASHGEPEKSISISRTALELASTYNKIVDQACKTKEEKEKKPSRANMRALWNIAIASLETGNYEQGFRLYDAGFDVELGLLKLRHYPKIPLWNGEKCETLLIYGDQGIGDEIMYASLIPELSKTHNIILECHPRLENIFKKSFPAIPVYPTRKNEVEQEWLNNHKISAATSMCLLPKHFRKTKEDFPGAPYLVAEPEVEPVRSKLKSLKRKIKVGISWAGGTVDTGKKYRNIKLEQLKPLLEMDVDFISLQYTKEAKEDIERFTKETGIIIHHWQDVVDDYDKTASLLKSLDLVISVPQSVVHLAGALGVETIQLCPKYSMWQCGKHGEDAPWYRSVKNIWQKVPYEWSDVINETKEVLCKKLSQKAQQST